MDPIRRIAQSLRRINFCHPYFILVTIFWLVAAGFPPARAAPCGAINGLSLIQSSDGSYEVIAPASAGGFVHYWRDNSSVGFQWSSPTPFGANDVTGASVIQSNFTTNGIGHLEVVATVGTDLVMYWRDDGGSWQWYGPDVIDTGVRGVPGIVQGKWGSRGNFEVVAPRAAGGLAHYWSDNDSPTLPWYGPNVFGDISLLYDAVAVVQTNLGQGNLEVIARTGSTLHHYWRADGTTWQWNGPIVVATGVSGSPSFIQSRHGAVGNYEVLTPMVGGGMAHYWRDNDNPAYPWYGPNYVPNVFGTVTSVGVIHSNNDDLEWVAHIDGELRAGLRDDSGGTGWYGPYSFSAQACCTPQDKGMWGDAFSGEVVAIHAALLSTGKVLLHGFADNSFADGDDVFGVSRVFDPQTGVLSVPSYSTAEHPIGFCSGQSTLPDGRMFMAGGHAHHVATAHLFDPVSQNWSYAGTFNAGRWYPTTTTLPNGQVFVISGATTVGYAGNPADINNTWQIYDTGSGTLLPAQTVTPSPFSADGHGPVDLYPFVYVLPDGRLFVHSRNSTRFFDPGTGTWEATRYDTNWPFSRAYPSAGSSVLLPLLPDTTPPYRPRVMVMGGAGSSAPVSSTPATATAELIDLGAAAPQWTNVPSMNLARVMPDAVLMPDGKVFVVGGSAAGRADMGTAPVLKPEIFDPGTNTWTTLCPMRVPRIYHSSALLLPDARILVAGKDGFFNEVPYKYPEHRVEIYSPPYLFKGTRPTITSAPNAVSYGSAFSIGVGAVAPSAIQRAALIRLGTATHSLNMDQRYVGLTFSQTAGGLTLQAPPSAAVAPPGHYMLFVVTGTGVPSVSKIVRLE